MQNNNKKRTCMLFLPNLIYAVLVSSQFLGIVAPKVVGVNRGFFAEVMIIVFSLFVITLSLQKNVRIPRQLLLMAGILSLYYLLTYLLMGNKMTIPALTFCAMCMIPMLCGGMVTPDFELVLRYTMYMSFIGLPVFRSLFMKVNVSTAYDTITMGNSYAYLPVFCAGIVHFCFFRKKAKLLDKIAYAVCLAYLIYFIPMGYRGPIAVLITVILLSVLFAREKTNKKILVLLLIAFSLAGIMLFFGENILTYVTDRLNERGIRIAFIEKSKMLLKSSGILHGRWEIYQAALRGFLDAPLFGHGMGTFEYYTGYIFPHNLVLQFLFDGGLFLTFLLLYVLIVGLVKSFRYTRRTERAKFAFILMITGLSLPRAIVSADVWRIVLLWLLIGMFMGRKTKQGAVHKVEQVAEQAEEQSAEQEDER